MASSATSTASLEEATEAQRAGYGTCEEGGKAAREAAEEELCRTAVWGLYCQYAAVGVVYGFSSTYLTLPICQYVFGPMGAPGRTSVQQCNICSTLSLLPWNLKVFYGIFLDRVGFFGTRRKGWILFGWATAMALLVVLASFAEHLVYHGQFATYVMLWMAVCAFYMIADVASDGMTVELSKLEPEETRGHILTTGQMVRFAMTLATSVLGTLTMNGESYYPARGGSDGTVFSFELSFGQVHIALLLMCVPFFSGMVRWLRDPPPSGKEDAHGLSEVASAVWETMKTKVFLFLVVYSLGVVAIAGFSNPASNIIQAIATPSTLQSSVGSFVGNILFLIGVWIFRAYFMNRNWRMTFVWTSFLTSIGTVFDFMTIYDAWGIGQDGWFYALSGQLLSLITGIAQVLSCLAIVEISPPGFEATVYEFLTTMHNSGISLSSNLQNIFLPIFQLNGISTVNYAAQRDEFNGRMAAATRLTLGVNIAGTLVFSFFAPQDKQECRAWLEDPRWRRTEVGVLVLAIGGSAFVFSTVVAFLSIFPTTMCLSIAGGTGC